MPATSVDVDATVTIEAMAATTLSAPASVLAAALPDASSNASTGAAFAWLPLERAGEGSSAAVFKARQHAGAFYPNRLIEEGNDQHRGNCGDQQIPHP